MNISDIIQDERIRHDLFPVTKGQIFLAHAGVTALPKVAVEAMNEFVKRGAEQHQENLWAWSQVKVAREVFAQLLGGKSDEVALLGPTALGLNLVAHGLPWNEGDEVVYYFDDYPANVYPWRSLESRGVKPVALEPPQPGAIDWEVIEQKLTSKTKLVALASANFLSGYRIDVDEIGRRLHERDILFCLDAIQTLGAFPLSVKHVDFLSADSHKWLLGPVGAGVFYVSERWQEKLKPLLVGSWNVVSPHFIAQPEWNYYHGARRYEPGTLNLPGILGMLASAQLILELGVESIADRILHLRSYLFERAHSLGWNSYLEEESNVTGILSLHHPTADVQNVFNRLEREGVVASLRRNRKGDLFIRFSPHFYNSEAELDRVAELLIV